MAHELIVHVVDDDIAVRQSLAFLFATAGISTRLYDSAEAFLQVCTDATAGCVVTDVRMPGMDGLELLRRLKGLGSALPVIVITGHGDIALAVAAMKDGRITYEHGYGMADLSHDIKITPDAVFYVASMSKQFTAMAVFMLAEEGKISLDDPI